MERFFCFVFLGSIESSVPISPQKLKGTCNFTLLCALPSRVGGTQGSQALCPALKPALHWGRYNGWILCRLYYRHEQNACFYTRWARHFHVGILINKWKKNSELLQLLVHAVYQVAGFVKTVLSKLKWGCFSVLILLIWMCSSRLQWLFWIKVDYCRQNSRVDFLQRELVKPSLKTEEMLRLIIATDYSISF